MAGVCSWNDVDVLVTFNFDLYLFQRLQDPFFNIMPLMGTSTFSAYLVEPLQLNLDNGRSDVAFHLQLLPWS